MRSPILALTVITLLGLSGCGPSQNPKVGTAENVLHANTPVQNASLSTDGHYAIIASQNLPAGLWDLRTNVHLYNFQNSKENKIGIVATGFSPDGHFAATAERENIALWDVTKGTPLSYWMVKSTIHDLAVSRDGHYVLLGLENGHSEYVEMETGLSVRSYAHSAPVNSVALSDDGRYAATASDDSAAMLWDVQTGQNIHAWKHDKPVSKIIISPKSNYVLTATVAGKITLFDRKSGKVLKSTLPMKGVVSAAAFSPSEKYVVISTLPEKTTVWDLSKSKALQSFKSPTAIRAVAFNPEENLIFTEDADGHGMQLALTELPVVKAENIKK